MYEVPGRVSIVAPSMATRQHYHENLYRCFEAQDYPDKDGRTSDCMKIACELLLI